MTLYQRLDGTMSDNVRNREETTQMLKTAIEELFLTATVHDSDVVTTGIIINKSSVYDTKTFLNDVLESIRYILEQNDPLREDLIPKEILEVLVKAGLEYNTYWIKDLVKIYQINVIGNEYNVYNVVINNQDITDYVSSVSGFRQIVYDLANPNIPDSEKSVIRVVVSDGCRQKYFSANSDMFAAIVAAIYSAFDLTIDRIYHTKTAIEIHQD